MVQSRLDEEREGVRGGKVRKEQGSARERAEARMLKAAICASLEAPGREEEAGGDADRDSLSSALLVSSQMDQDQGHTQAMQCPLLTPDMTGEQICAGKRVEVLFGNGRWYAGTVSSVTRGQWAAVNFDDGDRYTVQLPDPAIRLYIGRGRASGDQ